MTGIITDRSHLQDAQKLTADAFIDFFEFSLVNVQSPTFVRFRDGPPGGTTTFNGLVYDHLPCKLTGLTRSAEDAKSRPQLTAMNPAGIFNAPAANGNLDGAQVIRRRALRAHVEANIVIFDTNMWKVGRVVQVIAGQGITLELRSLSDSAEQLLPARMYIPPDFPFVTLS